MPPIGTLRSSQITLTALAGKRLCPQLACGWKKIRLSSQTQIFCLLKPKDVKPKLHNLEPPLVLGFGIMMVLCSVAEWFPSAAEPLTLDLLPPGLPGEVHCSPHHTGEQAVLGIRIKNKTEKLVASVQLREDKLLRGGRRRELLRMTLSPEEHT